MSGPVLALVLLATYRLALLLGFDIITARPVHGVRGWLLRRRHPDPNPDTAGPDYAQAQRSVLVARALNPPWLVRLIDCPAWCASFWIGLAVGWSGWMWGDRAWWFVPALALAASAVAGVLADLAHPEGRQDEQP